MGKVIRNFLIAGTGVAATYGIMKAVAKKRTEPTDIDDDNPYIETYDCARPGDEKAASSVHENKATRTTYERVVKPFLDQILSFIGLVVLIPVFGVISLAVYIDDPGPVFFTQKRIGKDKHYILIHKFRSMKMNTPHNVPTHQLENPEKYITKVGKVLRASSLDELPQIWDIFRKRMSVIGPRPALWNQDDLVAERDKYGANSVLPGLTGLAQIRGRDELEIVEKARIDGEYVSSLSFVTDCKCFFGTIESVLKHDGIVEGGTGSRSSYRPIKSVDPADVGFEDYGYKKKFHIDKHAHKSVLIAGAGSYIGESFKTYCESYYPNIECTTIDMVDGNWREYDFSRYDTIFHVAGIAHADVGKAAVEEQKKYYEVNTDLAVECCKKAKASGVKQFILMSSMIIYGGAERIDEHTVPEPQNFYGNSKWLADKGVRELDDKDFHVAVLRPPMIYGRGSKGNYPILSKIARKLAVFPDVDNRRSMLYIENLCEFVSLLVLSNSGGVFFPQNKGYASTSRLVHEISITVDKPTYTIKLLNFFVFVAKHVPLGKVQGIFRKAFGNSYYIQKLSVYEGMDYQKVDLRSSIIETESDRISVAG